MLYTVGDIVLNVPLPGGTGIMKENLMLDKESELYGGAL